MTGRGSPCRTLDDVSGPAEVKRRRAPRGSGEHLREEILDAATDLLLETGHAKAVSIRSVAQRVGVTPPSIYLHFADKDALLDAVCARYFEKLDEEMQRVAAGQPSAIDVLRAQGLAYVRFATETPELYRIATMGEGRPGSDVDVTLNSSAFLHMRGSIEALIAEGIYPPGDPTMLALELWTAAHGVAAMLISRPYLPWGDVEAFADRVLRAVCCGHIMSTIIDVETPPQQAIALMKEMADERPR
jgi:AcrR family transcriptional regulator